MKKYWLCIESSVFIWKDDERILFYNSKNFDKIIQKRGALVTNIIDLLLDPCNFYSALYSDTELINIEFQDS